ncbi:MAG TPA: hypothetical protein VK419_15735 [Bryobacteraceae bacterium]|nr:hypothetical protein [Bryobacteraceae bacterium]
MRLEILGDMLKIFRCRPRPADSHLAIQQSAQAAAHFFFFDKLSPIGLSYADLDGAAKVFLIFEQPQRSVFHQALGVGARVLGDPGKFRFLFRREMNFHRL